jgi:CRP-like cAMP-binding protein
MGFGDAPVDVAPHKLLSRHFLFTRLPEAALADIAALATTRRLADGETIFEKGEPGSSMMAVVDGRVRISLFSEDGKEIILNIIEAGGLFGEVALLDGGERTANATAMGRTTLLVLDRRDVFPFLERNPAIMMRLFEVLCERVRRTSELVEDVALLDFEARLARLLLRLAATYGRKTDGRLAIGLRLSQQDLGHLVASTRESVNRQLNRWAAEGLIEMDRSRITILDEAGLTRRIMPDS